jgi:hypothetical protein
MILIENPLGSKASWENDPSIAPMDLKNSQFDQVGHHHLETGFMFDALL